MTKKTELTFDDVVEIKRHLLFKDLKQKEIALKFSVAPSAVSKIKNGHSYADIQIDDDGNVIEEQILAENYPVQVEIEEKVEKEAIDDDSSQYRFQFVNDYFLKKDSGRYEPSSSKSNRFIGSLYNSRKWLFNDDWSDFISQIMLIVTETVFTYEPNVKFDWLKANTAGTSENSSLHSYINKAIKHELDKYANKINDVYQIQKGGEISWASPIVESVDAVNSTEEGDFAIVEELGNDSNLFNLKNDYKGSHFLSWFTDKKDELLTREQVKFLNVMKFFIGEKDDDYVAPYSQIPDKYKPYSQSSIEHNRRRIRNRVNEAYEEVKPLSLRKMEHEKELEFWNSFKLLVENDDELERQNQLATNWLKNRISHKYIGNLTWELGAKDMLNFKNCGSVMNAKTLYKIYKLVEARIIVLESYEDKLVPFQRYSHEYMGMEKEDYRERQRKIAQEYKEAQGKGRNKLVLLPSGISR